jgi:AcrR family transcriptional regulator
VSSGKRSRLKPTKRREQILRCARQLFVASGYEAVSTTQIAEAAGVTSALVHHYFGSKRDLYLEVVTAIVETARDVSTTVIDSTHPIELRTAATIDAWLDYIAREGDAWLSVTAHGGAISDPEIKAIIADARDTCARRMLRTYSSMIPDTQANRLVMRSFIYFNEAVSREWLAGNATREQAHTLLTETLLDLLTRIAPVVNAVGDGDRGPVTAVPAHEPPVALAG